MALIGRVEDLEARLELPSPSALIDGSSGTWKSVPTVSSDKISVPTITGVYNDVQDWMNTTQSSGKISGGAFTDNTDGTVKIGAGTGIIRAIDDELGEARFFSWEEHAVVTLTDNSTNYIIITYGKDPVVSATVTKADGTNRNVILLGKIYRSGTDLHFAEAGMIITEATKRVLTYLTQVHGEVVRASGYAISESGARYLASSNGVLFAGLTMLTTTGIDTDGAPTFATYYYDGDLGTPAWVEGTASQIDNANYNAVATGLAALTANRYGVHWVYGDPGGHILVVYGQGDYTLANAESANPPSSLPSFVADFCFIAAKIIVQEGEASLYVVESAYETQFTPAGAADHGELAGLTDNDHPQYRATTGTAQGDGNASQAITGVGFAPTHLILFEKIVADDTVMDRWETFDIMVDNHAAGLCYTINNAGNVTMQSDAIVSLDADGFTIGTGGGSPNANGKDLEYVAYY